MLPQLVTIHLTIVVFGHIPALSLLLSQSHMAVVIPTPLAHIISLLTYVICTRFYTSCLCRCGKKMYNLSCVIYVNV